MSFEINEPVCKAVSACEDVAEKVLADLSMPTPRQSGDNLSASSTAGKSEKLAVPTLALFDSAGVLAAGRDGHPAATPGLVQNAGSESVPQGAEAARRSDKNERGGSSPDTNLTPEDIRKMLSSQGELMALDAMKRIGKMFNSLAEDRTKEQQNKHTEDPSLRSSTKIPEDAQKRILDILRSMQEAKPGEALHSPRTIEDLLHSFSEREAHSSELKKLNPETLKTIKEILKKMAEGASDLELPIHNVPKIIEDAIKQLRKDYLRDLNRSPVDPLDSYRDRVKNVVTPIDKK